MTRIDERMNPEVKALWLAALRSGEYEQLTGALKAERPDGSASYCCLGVLSDLAPASCGKFIGDAFVSYAGTVVAITPSSVRSWSGLSKSSGAAMLADVAGRRFVVSLAFLNDDGFTFDQIADVIEYAL